MRSKKMILSGLVFAVLGSASPALAGILTFVFEGTGSGTLNGTPFSTSGFTIISTGDTSNRQSFVHGWLIDNTSSIISISGVSTCTVQSPTHTFVNNFNQAVGYSRSTSPHYDLIDGPNDPTFQSWDMLSPIGPITGTGSLTQWNNPYPPINTSCGVLIFNNGSTNLNFTVLPEPASLCLLVIAAMGLIATELAAKRALRIKA